MEATAVLPLPAGSIVGERYRVIGHLGAGGMGTVYRVEHTMMSKQLALKLLRPEFSSDASVSERFEREAKSAARLDHARIVRVTDFGKAPDGALFMVMELVEGKALSEHLKVEGRVTVDQALDLVDQILEALGHAHSHDVVHRDIKPGNIMLASGGPGFSVKLVDFGIAKITAREGSDGAQLTQMGMVVGTPRYMSPEQATAELVDARSDLYSVGVLLYELLAGRAPFEGASSVEILTKHLTATPPPLSTPKLDALVSRALAKKRDARFQTAEEFREAIALVKSGGTPTRGPRPPRSPLPWRWIAGGVAALGVVILAMMSGGSSPPLTASGEEAMARGDLPAARAIVQQALAKNPEDARAHLLQASIARAEDRPDTALASITRAVELDRALTADPVVVNAVRAEVDTDSKQAEAYVAMYTAAADERSTTFLTALAKTAKRPVIRKTAYSALERMGELDELDVLTWLGEELRTGGGQPCTARKWYVERLIALHDERAAPILKKELGRKGGFLNLSSVSECMSADIRAHLKEIEPARP